MQNNENRIFPKLPNADLPEHAEQVVGSDFNRHIRNQRSQKPPGTKSQLENLRVEFLGTTPYSVLTKNVSYTTVVMKNLCTK